MLCPEDVRDYVVVHELCRRKVMNHSAEFWNEVRRVMPEYDIWRRWLKEHKAAKWLSKEMLRSVEWLPSDVEVLEKVEELLE